MFCNLFFFSKCNLIIFSNLLPLTNVQKVGYFFRVGWFLEKTARDTPVPVPVLVPVQLVLSCIPNVFKGCTVTKRKLSIALSEWTDVIVISNVPTKNAQYNPLGAGSSSKIKKYSQRLANRLMAGCCKLHLGRWLIRIITLLPSPLPCSKGVGGWKKFNVIFEYEGSM